MTKNLKLNVKNPQIAGAINLSGLKAKLSKKKPEEEAEEAQKPEKLAKEKEGKEKELKAKKKEKAVEAEVSEEKKPKAKAKAKTDVTTAEAKESKQHALEAEMAEVKTKQEPAKAIEKQSSAIVHEAHETQATEEKKRAEAVKLQPAKPEPTKTEVSKAEVSKAEVSKAEVSKPEAVRLGPVFPEKKSPEEIGAKRETPQSTAHPKSQFREDFQKAQSHSQTHGSQTRGFRPDSRPPHREGSWGPRPPHTGHQQTGQGPSGPPTRRPPYPPRPQSHDRDRPYQRPPFTGPSHGPRPSGPRPYPGQGHHGAYSGGRPPMGGPMGGQRPGSPRGPMAPPPQAVPPGQKEGARDFKPRTERAPDVLKKGGLDEGFGKGKGKAKDTVIKRPEMKAYDARVRHGFVSTEEDEGSVWRKKRHKSGFKAIEKEIVRPTKIKVRLPISIKDLSAEMKLKASELVSKLFIQGIIVTLNDVLDDPTVVELLGHEFGCEIGIDTSEEERIRISDKNVREEILSQDPNDLITRPPVVAFMGHVDHGKTSLIDAIRKSNRAAKEVGAITQHIGAFKCVTPQGAIAILDTPGHEAFTLMRERGAHVTDIVVLVVAGDEGIQEQTIEAIKQARQAKATIVVALTKSDKPNFNPDHIYRQLADQELLPEAWGGQTIVVNTSAVTSQGIPELLEMLALQAEVLELRANPKYRARGTVIESEIKQGLGATATVLVQNGTLRLGDALVFGVKWAKIKSMRNEDGVDLKEAPPSTPVQITGLSGLPEAGEEFIVVKSEKEARDIAEMRQEGRRETTFQKKRRSLESLMESAKSQPKKTLTLILRADVQGSLEALTKALERIESAKVEVNIISSGIGQISESDAELANASNAIILGFHTSVEAHTELLIKEMGIKVHLASIIYHAVDKVKELMKALLDKLPVEVEKGKAEVKATFKASQLGVIAGCIVIEGVITRQSQIRLKRGDVEVWKGNIASLKRVKEDVKEVQKGIECGILLQNNNDVQVGDIMEAFEVTYVEQEL